MLRFFFTLLAPLLTALSLQAKEPTLPLLGSFEKGKIYQLQQLRLLVLEGSYFEMGRQYGALAKERLPIFLETASQSPSATKIITRYKTTLKELIQLSLPGYSARQKELLRGMSETSGIPVTDLILADQNLALGFLFEHAIGCSFLAAWGDYTKDGKLILGRNFDWFAEYRDRLSDLLVIVFKPTDGSLATAIIAYTGMIGALTGINERGIFLELNNGMNSFGPVVSHQRISYLNALTDFLWDSEEMPSLERRLFSTRAQWPNIINIADAKQAFSFENAPFDTRRRKENFPGLLASTNDMMLESWGILTFPSATHSQRRYHNLLKLGNEYKGRITPLLMQEIFDTPLTNSDASLGKGATEIYSISSNPNIAAYQVIAVPEDLKLWIKVPTKTEWIPLDLTEFFD